MAWAFLAALGVGLFIVAAVILARRAIRARTEALRQASVALGFIFEGESDLERIRMLADVPLFERGHSKHIRNIMDAPERTM